MNVRRLAGIGGVAFLSYVAWGIYRAGLGETPPPAASTDIVFHEGVANGQRITTRSWSARFDRLVSNADQTVLDLDNVRDGTIFKAGKPYLHLRAQHMTVNTLTRDFSVAGHLHVETVSERPARSFDTSSAHWSDGLQRLDLDKQVSIESGASAPLIVGSLSFDVKTGEIDLKDIAGGVRFK